MKLVAACFAVAAYAASGIVFQYAAAATPEACPISYSRLSMPYKHEMGTSTPLVDLSFTNETRKKIVQAKFGLLITGPQGNQVPYEKGLTFSAGADPGKVTSSEWRLEMDKVDIERLGEIIYLKSVRFEDNTVWRDDGNERCRQEVYYGPK